MEKVKDKARQRAEEAARIIDEYKQRLAQAMEEEAEESTREAEEESA